MGLYAIGDLHLSLKVNKPMDIFGPGWADHTARLASAFIRAFTSMTLDEIEIRSWDEY